MMKELFKEFEPILRNVAGKYAIGHRTNPNELFSAVCLKFCEKATDLVNQPDQGIRKAMVINWSQEACRDFIAADRTLVQSRDTFYKHLTEDDLPNRENFEEFDMSIDHHFDVGLMLHDICNRCTSYEIFIITCFLEGRSVEEVAKILSITPQYLWVLRKRIQNKLQDYLN